MQLALALACTWVQQSMFVAAVAGFSRLFLEDGTALLLESGDFLLLE